MLITGVRQIMAAGASPTVDVSYGLLGPLEVTVGEHVIAVGGPNARALLAALLLAPEIRASTERLYGWHLHTAAAAADLLYPHVIRIPLPPSSLARGR